MNKSEIKLCIIVIGLMILAFAVVQYLTIRSIDIQKSQNYLYPDGTSTTIITIVPLNRWGHKVLFRKPEVEFILNEGVEKIIVINKESDSITIRSKFETGNVTIFIKNKYTLVPICIVIPIIKPTA
jgi:hypothetical protein